MQANLQYAFSRPHGGRALIISNGHFKQDFLQDLDFDNDVFLIKETFLKLGFRDENIVVHYDKTASEMIQIIEKAGQEDYSASSCFVCAIFSHGAYDRLYPAGEHVRHMTDVIWGVDKVVQLELLMETVKPCMAPTLQDKPKIFIVNACRGYIWSRAVALHSTQPPPSNPSSVGPLHELPGHTQPQLTATTSEVSTEGVDMVGRTLTDTSMDEEPDSLAGGIKPPCHIGRPVGAENLRKALSVLHYSTLPEDIPLWKDFLLVYSTQPGFSAPQPHPLYGSPLIKALNEHAGSKMDFLKVLTRAISDVAVQYDSDNYYKVMPWIASRLTKNIYFNEHV